MLLRAAMPSLFALSSLLLCTLFFSAPVVANFITLYPDQPGKAPSSINMTYYTDENYLYVTVTHAYFSWIGIGWHAASDRFGDPSAMYVAFLFIFCAPLASTCNIRTVSRSDPMLRLPYLILKEAHQALSAE